MWSACHEGNGQEWLERSLDFLAGYSVKHFADEEKLQIQYAYPDYIRHKQLHEDFKLTTRGLQERLIREGATDALVDEVCTCLGDWFVSHIQGEDFALAAHIKSKDGENMNCQESP
jgi:hemerythrin